jgi:hypothetical protein
MATVRDLLGLGLALAVAVGCSGGAPTTAPSGAPVPVTPAPPPEVKQPQLESELVQTVKGQPKSNTHRMSRDKDGKPFYTIDGFATTVVVGETTVKYDLTFEAHRGGKDVYKFTYTVTTNGNARTTTTEVAYDGRKTVLVEDEFGSLVLQPPTK